MFCIPIEPEYVVDLTNMQPSKGAGVFSLMARKYFDFLIGLYQKQRLILQNSLVLNFYLEGPDRIQEWIKQKLVYTLESKGVHCMTSREWEEKFNCPPVSIMQITNRTLYISSQRVYHIHIPIPKKTTIEDITQVAEQMMNDKYLAM